MATTDLSRHATNYAKHYAGARIAQGQVLSDDDFNDAARIVHEDTRRTRVDIIGPAGSPDGGFTLSDPTIVAGAVSFAIAPGTFYLGGLRLTLEQRELFHLQRDWLQQTAADRPVPPKPGGTRFDAVYVEAWQTSVSGVEDGELMEPAFGGAPPALRVRTMRRIRVEADVGSDDCKVAWTTVEARWAGLGNLQPDTELKPDATLQIGYGGAGAPLDLCAPGVVTGFLGAENTVIRLQTIDGNRFVWGLDNASKIYRVEVLTLGGGRRKIRFISIPKDPHSRPLAGQIVELLPWSAALANRVRPDGTLDRCEKTAELAGHLAVVESSYNPSEKTLTLTPADALPAGFGEDWKSRDDKADLLGSGVEYYFLRVWDQGLDSAAGPKSIAFLPGVPVPLGTTGLTVTLNGTQFPAGLFWIVGARPETADLVVPWQFDGPGGRAPQGLRRYRAPLGIIRWTNSGGTISGEVVDDCRPTFLPLTKIGGCCSVSVGDGSTSHGHFTSINAAIAALPASGGEVCVLAGHYLECVDLKGRSNISIHGCGQRTVVECAVKDGVALGPVFDVTVTRNVSLSELTIIAHGQQPGVFAGEPGTRMFDLSLADLWISAGPRCGIELLGGRSVEILRCDVAMRNEPGPWPAIYSGGDDVSIERCHVTADVSERDGRSTRARGGVQIGGGSERVRVVDNLIERGIGNGITLGSLIRTDGRKDDGIIFWIIDPRDECDPCKPGDIVVIVIPGHDGKPTIRSAGDLYDILIERNRIFDMGLNGVGVVGFFDLLKDPQIIAVEELRILGNVIRGCLWRELAETTATTQLFAGYGAISLAECRGLLVRDNDLVENGRRDIDPICGVFVLIGFSVEISRNRIEENGARTDAPPSRAHPGYRSGIHVAAALPELMKVEPTREVEELAKKSGLDVGRFQRNRGVNSLSVHDNVVTQPLGRSITAMALGHVSIANNTLTSRGIMTRDLSQIIAGNVLVAGLGVTNELDLDMFRAVFDRMREAFLGKGEFDEDFKKQMCGRFRDPRAGETMYPGYVLPSSKVMFVDNRCALDLMTEPSAWFVTPILVGGADDVAFGSNQCEADMPRHTAIVGSILGAMSVRVFDNRFAETRSRVKFSSSVVGLMNTTTNNQSTHCINVASPVPSLIVATGNRALIEFFCGLCERMR